MSRRFVAALLGITAIVMVGLAQPPGGDAPTLRYKWQPGQALTYKVAQQTVVQETALDPKTEKPITTESRTT